MLTNASFDATGSFELTVRRGGKFRLLSDSGELIPMKQTSSDGETKVTIDGIAPWSYIIVTNRNI